MKENIVVIQKHIAGLKHVMNERINLIQGELEILKKGDLSTDCVTDIKTARRCMDFQLIRCKNKNCINESCPLNKVYDNQDNHGTEKFYPSGDILNDAFEFKWGEYLLNHDLPNDAWVKELARNFFKREVGDQDKGEIEYGCGHKSEPIFLDNSELSMGAWLQWKDSVGFKGDKSMCWDCWYKEQSKDGFDKICPQCDMGVSSCMCDEEQSKGVTKCLFWKGRCNSDYGINKNLECDGISPPEDCPYPNKCQEESKDGKEIDWKKMSLLYEEYISYLGKSHSDFDKWCKDLDRYVSNHGKDLDKSEPILESKGGGRK